MKFDFKVSVEQESKNQTKLMEANEGGWRVSLGHGAPAYCQIWLRGALFVIKVEAMALDRSRNKDRLVPLIKKLLALYFSHGQFQTLNQK